ncbi:MAG: transglycosylase domain-containing protein [Vicinamibacterales bacterium]|nr:transglycosylase domain-containing protein [Vicinamibacterales bacterium]
MTDRTHTSGPSPDASIAPSGEPRERIRAFRAGLRVVRRFAARMWATRRRLVVLLAVAVVSAIVVLSPAVWLVHHVYFERAGLPDLEAFIRFEPPTTGIIRDVHGTVLIELAREYRQVVTYDEIPTILRQAILAAEDKHFFSHAGVDYRVAPRVIQKTAARSLAEWWKGDGRLRLLLPQGGSTLTQQLVRGYFLQILTSRTNEDPVFHAGLAPPRLLSVLLGAPAMNKLLRKMEEVRLTLWLEHEMRRRYGSQQAKQEIFARYASFIYLGNGRYGFAAASEYYFGKHLSSYGPDDAGTAALLAAISKAPRDYAPVPGNRRTLARRNQILALMARNAYIPLALATRCQGEPIHVVTPNPIKTQAPAAIEHVLSELTQRGAGRFGVEDLFQGRIIVRATIDARVQTVVNNALERGLVSYEKRHPASAGTIQGSVVVLRNADGAVLAEAGGRQVYNARDTRYSDYNRVTESLRQPGSAMKPLVYLAAFESGLDLDTEVPDEPIHVPTGNGGATKLIANYDHVFKGPIPVRQALAESRNAVAVWLTRQIGVRTVIRAARQMGIHSPLQPYLSTALGASEVRLLELADAYRGIASGILAEPYVIARVTDSSGEDVYVARPRARLIQSAALQKVQEGLRGVVRIPGGTANVLDHRDFPIPVMGKTGTTSDFRDALFVGSTYGPGGITVAVRIGFDDNRPLGTRETGGRAALPVFREIMLRIHQAQLAGPTPRFPRAIEHGIDQYLARRATLTPSVGSTTDGEPAEGSSDSVQERQALLRRAP